MELHWNCSGFSANFIMRRTAIIFAIAALLCGSAAYGSKKPRERVASTASSHKKAKHSTKRPERREERREAAYRSSFFHRSRRRHAKKIESAATSRRLPETAPADRPSVVEPALLTSSRIAMPAPLRGSRESLVRQNEKSEETDGLERIQDDDDLNARIADGLLVPVPVSAALTVNGKLPENRRYCRPWTASFLSDLAQAHEARFHSSLLVTSAVRTVAYQKELERINGNAAAAEGDIASPHLTGESIDIAKQGLSRQEIGWMRARLLALEEASKIDVEEEFQQACFHITVYKSYAPPQPPHKTPAESAPAQTAQDQTGKTTPKQLKNGRRKPVLAAPAKPKPEEPEQPQPAPDSQAEAPIAGQ